MACVVGLAEESYQCKSIVSRQSCYCVHTGRSRRIASATRCFSKRNAACCAVAGRGSSRRVCSWRGVGDPAVTAELQTGRIGWRMGFSAARWGVCVEQGSHERFPDFSSDRAALGFVAALGSRAVLLRGCGGRSPGTIRTASKSVSGKVVFGKLQVAGACCWAWKAGMIRISPSIKWTRNRGARVQLWCSREENECGFGSDLKRLSRSRPRSVSWNISEGWRNGPECSGGQKLVVIHIITANLIRDWIKLTWEQVCLWRELFTNQWDGLKPTF